MREKKGSTFVLSKCRKETQTHTFQQVVSSETLSVLHILHHEVSKFVYVARGPKSVNTNLSLSFK